MSGDFVTRASWGRTGGKYHARTSINGTTVSCSGFDTLDACFGKLAELSVEALRKPAQHEEISSSPIDPLAFVP